MSNFRENVHNSFMDFFPILVYNGFTAKEVVLLKNFRRDFERFCYRHQYKGIPNLMLYVALGTALVYFIALIDPSGLFVSYLRFNREAIFHGQVWRLVSYIFVPSDVNPLFLAISLYFYYIIGRMIQSSWGVFRFNLYYFAGVLLTDLGALILGVNATIGYLNLSLTLAFATMFPENRVLLFYIIPIKMKYLAWFYFALTLIQLFSGNLFPLFALLNYLLFFGGDVCKVLPDFLQPRRNKKSFGSFAKKSRPDPNWAKDYRSKTGEKPYRHKCTVCGRTDTTDPQLEFRYCSKCNGYYCYCMEHINDHAHVE